MALNTMFLGIPIYTFNSNPCGLCVILYNSSFEKCDYRIGANVDVQTLSETFSKLNFKVKTEVYKSKSQMYDIIRKCGNEKDVNCFVCFISLHGKLETVFGSDEEPLTFEEMRSAINDNDDNLLIGKPKIFFIQACQGENFLEMYNDSRDSRYLRKPDFKPELLYLRTQDLTTALPKNADYCLSVTTTPGHHAWRNEKGTVYFQTLCRIINNLLVTNKQKSLFNILLLLEHEMRKHLIIVSTQAENPSILKGNLCNIAFNSLREDVYFEKWR
ncbi:caspase-7-like [Hydra vulgaris]|uniref:Caspase-7-like n=1 Tax=Hydra vulgaris TaxID=6087 RepID=A0ABM4B146_HYDVU